MTCAKAQVHAYLLGTDGVTYHGTNHCARPQAVCPRAPGEGYAKCKDVCGQSAHAEVNAIRAAGDAARGAIVVVDYHYVCDACKLECAMSEVKPSTVEEWLAAGNTIEKLGDTNQFKNITPRMTARASFGNLPPKQHFAPPAARKPRRHRIRMGGE